MKRFILILILQYGYGYCQKETNIWYFGQNAGLDFNTGVPVPLLDGALDTEEGCATLSDTNGNLLFYTDGVTVYNRNHQVMLNGTGLNGDVSSTNSAIIVPKPEDQSIYYIFTVDDLAESNGLQYSEVDMSLDGGFGVVTNNKNILLHTPTTEKVTAVKKPNINEYWVVSHKWNSDEFIAYDVSSTGVNTTPIISSVGTFVNSTNLNGAIGQIKISPDGKKIAVARFEGFSEAQLFDFDAATGTVSNPLTLIDYSPNTEKVYGVEFSPNSKVLYVSIAGNGVYQYNLEAGTQTDIFSSQLLLTTLPRPYGSMQLATDGKIYIAKNNQFYIDVIDNPNVVGLGCNYQFEHLYLEGKRSKLGLPPFIQSFLQIEDIKFENICYGDTTNFTLQDAVDSVIWNFGDAVSGTNTSTEMAPSHVFSTPGDYNVSVEVTVGGQTTTKNATVTIFETPVVNDDILLQQCDDNQDGFSVFNLNDAITDLSANAVNETFTFYESQTDAEAAINEITNSTTYTNQTINTDTIWVSVENANTCYSIVSLVLNVSTTQIPSTFKKEFYRCVEDSENGITSFNFSSVTTEIQEFFPAGQQLVVTYYENQEDALAKQNAIEDTTNHKNTNSPFTQTIFIRVDNAIDNSCLGLGGHIILNAEKVPVADMIYITQCDTDDNGVESIDTSNIETQLFQGQTNITIEYQDEETNTLPSPLPNPFITGSQKITAVLTNNNSLNPEGKCYTMTYIDISINNGITLNPVPEFSICDNDNDGLFSFDTSNLESTLLGGQINVNISYTDEMGTILESPFPDSYLTGTQTITARVENSTNPECFDEVEINFVVEDNPELTMSTVWSICDGETIEISADEGFDDYLWSTGETTSSIFVDTIGEYSVTVTNNSGDLICETSKTITVVKSSPPIITKIETIDWSQTNNEITVFVEGNSDYEYSLDGISYQNSNVFKNILIGDYTVFVRDKNGCGTVTQDIYLLYYPHFFTPNNDGFHDTWQIYNSEREPNNVVYIYNRYGKLLKQLNPNSKGWDGTFNDAPLPTADYWFTVKRQNNKQYKGHFALRR